MPSSEEQHHDDYEMMTVQDVMRLLKVSRLTAYRRIVAWKLRIVRDGRLIRVFRADFENAIKERVHSY